MKCRAGGGQNLEKTERELKAEVIYDAMYAGQPQFGDFRGRSGYSDYALTKDEEKLDLKMQGIYADKMGRFSGAAADDDYAKNAEPVITYALDQRAFSGSQREGFAYLASEYDDKFNGTDVVLGLEKPARDGFYVYAIDVATGTDPRNIAKKVANHASAHGSIPPWTAYLKYCKEGDARWKEPRAPSFVLGLSPAGLDVAMDSIAMEDGMLNGWTPNAETEFKLASELKEQIELQRIILKRQPESEEVAEQLKKLSVLGKAVTQKLIRICGVEGSDTAELQRDFLTKYPQMKERFMHETRGQTTDTVYINIMREVARQKSLERGKVVRQSA